MENCLLFSDVCASGEIFLILSKAFKTARKSFFLDNLATQHPNCEMETGSVGIDTSDIISLC